MTRRLRALALAGAVSMGIFVAFLSIGAGIRGAVERSGAWITVCADDSVSSGAMASALDPSGEGAVLTRETQPVSLADWSGGLRSYGLAEVLDDFVPGDPRVDDYVRGLDTWFRVRDANGADWNLYYLAPNSALSDPSKAAAAISVFGDHARVAMSRADDRSLEYVSAALCLLAVLVLVVGLSIGGEGLRRPAVSDWVPLLPFALLAASGMEGAVSGILLAVAFSGATARRREPERIRAAGFADLLLAVATFVALPASASAGMAASIAAALFAAFFSTVSSARTETPLADEPLAGHKPFRMTPISGQKETSGRSVQKTERKKPDPRCARELAVLLALCALAAPGIGAVFDGARGTSPAAAQAFGTEQTVAVSPDLQPSDWKSARMAHRAYQESLAFVPLWEEGGNPFGDAAIAFPEGRIVEKRFDQSWEKEAASDFPQRSIEAMLEREGEKLAGHSAAGLYALALVCILHMISMSKRLRSRAVRRHDERLRKNERSAG